MCSFNQSIKDVALGFNRREREAKDTAAVPTEVCVDIFCNPYLLLLYFIEKYFILLDALKLIESPHAQRA